jgi:hypothetical protein
VRARQDADLRNDRPHRVERAAVDTATVLDDVAPQDVGLALLEGGAEGRGRTPDGFASD